jgi:hypothetical protein
MRYFAAFWVVADNFFIHQFGVALRHMAAALRALHYFFVSFVSGLLCVTVGVFTTY